MENTKTKRAVLLDLANGGDGHPGPWIEKVTLRRPGQDDTAVYATHIPGVTKNGEDLVIAAHDGSLDLCQTILHITETGAQPGDPDATQEEREAHRRAWKEALPTPEDCGRIITDLSQLDKA